MSNAHENINNLTILNELNNLLKRTYKDNRIYSAEEQKYDDKSRMTKKILENENISNMLKLFINRNRWESGNIQKGIGINNVFDNALPWEQNPPLSDFMLKTIATPNMLESFNNLLSNIYDPASKANIDKVKDVGGKRKLDALTSTVESIYGDDKNILNIIKSLKE